MTHKNGEERVVGVILEINGVRVQRLTHKICEERVDGSFVETDGVRVQRFTHNNNNISEERADGLTLWLVDGDGSWCALGCVRCEKTWLRMAQVTLSTGEHEGTLRLWEEWKTWEGHDGVDGGGVDGFDGVDSGLGVDEWWCRWLRWRRWWWLRWRQWWSGDFDGVAGGGFDGVNGGLATSVASMMAWLRGMVVTGVFDTEGTDVEVPLCPQW